MATAWFCILWPGNPAIISLSVLKQDAHNNKGVTSNGIIAVRFITKELAETFKSWFNGVEVFLP